MDATPPSARDAATILTCPHCGAKNRVNAQRARQSQPVCGRCGAKLAAGDGGPVAPGEVAGEAAADASRDLSRPLEVSDETFARDVLGAGELPVLLDCWAPWCPPCRALAPTIDALAAESGGRYRVAKLDTDRNRATAARYDIQSIPTLLIFKGGRLVDRVVGLQSKSALAQRLAAWA